MADLTDEEREALERLVVIEEPHTGGENCPTCRGRCSLILTTYEELKELVAERKRLMADLTAAELDALESGLADAPTEEDGGLTLRLIAEVRRRRLADWPAFCRAACLRCRAPLETTWRGAEMGVLPCQRCRRFIARPATVIVPPPDPGPTDEDLERERQAYAAAAAELAAPARPDATGYEDLLSRVNAHRVHCSGQEFGEDGRQPCGIIFSYSHGGTGRP